MLASSSASSTFPILSLPPDLLTFICDQFLSDRQTVRLANAHPNLCEVLAKRYTVKTRREWILEKMGSSEMQQLKLLPTSGIDMRLLSAATLSVAAESRVSEPFGRVRKAAVLLGTRDENWYLPDRGYGRIRLDSLLPPSITQLALDHRANGPLDEVPPHLTALSFGTPREHQADGFAKCADEYPGYSSYPPIPHQLPTGLRLLSLARIREAIDLRCLLQLQELSIASLYGIPLTSITLPRSVTELRVLGGMFPTDPSWVPPPALTSLTILRNSAERVLDGVVLPQSLLKLKYPHMISQESIRALPRSLQELEVGCELLSELSHLPSLRTLYLDSIGKLDVALPSTLTCLRGVVENFSDAFTWPSAGVVEVQITSWPPLLSPEDFTLLRLPATLERLQIDEIDFTASFGNLHLPNLKYLNFNSFAEFSRHPKLAFVSHSASLLELELPSIGSGSLPTLPPKLERLTLNRYLHPLTCVQNHPALREVRVWAGFNHPLPQPLPPRLRVWQFGDFSKFNRSIEGVEWPPLMQHLALGAAFNQPVARLQLPRSLERLEFGLAFQQRDIVDLRLPKHLVHLHFHAEFRQQLRKSQIPPSCIWIVIGQGSIV